ncbi:hypothetical protein QJS66_03200 [Kocuria rhizophila]|nr:hypothetical protein QJS66_03200 [Kocuria rhizophila]
MGGTTAVQVDTIAASERDRAVIIPIILVVIRASSWCCCAAC